MKDLISALRGYFPSPTECEKAADELGRKAMQCAVLTVERDELRADLDAERDADELKSACITGMRQEITAWSITAENLEAELERERIRLAACGVVAMSDTPDSAIEARKMHPDYESASCDDVKRLVDECMALRAERDALKVRIETDMKSWYKLHYLMKKRGWHPGRTDDDLIEVLDEKLDALKVDAALWRDYQARKVSLKAAGFGKLFLCSEAPDTYAVINKEGDVEYSASWPEACHDHIKEMQDAAGLGYVVGWKVRAIKILPTYKDIAIKEANHAI